MHVRIENRTEVVLPRRAVPNPTPNLNPGGDCGPCVLAGVLGLSSPQAVYDEHFGSKPCSIGYGEMQRILRVENGRRLDRIIEHPPTWLGSDGEYTAWLGAFGWAAWRMAEPWFRHLQMAVDAGYYGLAQVDSTKTGGDAQGGPDHWVMLCGARSWVEWTDRPEGRSSGKPVQQVLVSCSARSTPDEEWVCVREFLRERGGFSTIYARPTT